jgi:hypothetical protein
MDICPASKSKIKEYSDKWSRIESSVLLRRLLLFDPSDDHLHDTEGVFLIKDFGKLFTVFKSSIKDLLIRCDKEVIDKLIFRLNQ